MRGECIVVEREVRRRDHGHAIGVDLRGMGGDRHGVGGGLRAGVHDQHPRQRVTEGCGHPAAFVEGQKHAFAGRATHEGAIRAVRLEVVGIGGDGVDVQRRAVIGQWRDGGDDQRSVVEIGQLHDADHRTRAHVNGPRG